MICCPTAWANPLHSGSEFMRRLLVIGVACLVGPAAWAHAFLDRASPAVGSEVSGSPPVLTLAYTEPVEPFFSRITVTDSLGMQVNDGNLSAQGDGRVL